MMIETIGAMTMSVPSDREIVLTRDFDAPRSLVFDMFVKPEHLRRWWGLRGSTLTVCDIDLRPGGAWRYVTRGPKGHENPFKGTYKEIMPPERLVYTLVYDVEGAREYPGWSPTSSANRLAGRDWWRTCSSRRRKHATACCSRT